MATTSTYAWQPAAGDLILAAFARMQIRRSELTQMHLADAANEASFLQVEFSNRLPLWWTLEEYTQVLTAEVATYVLPERASTIVAANIITTSGSQTQERLITPVSAYEYASFPDKTTLSEPTVFWFNRKIIPEITLWPVPDDEQTYTLSLKFFRQIQDIAVPNGTNIDFPVRFYDSFTANLAARLALIYKPEAYDRLAMIAERSWGFAAETDADDGAQLMITPGLSGYFR